MSISSVHNKRLTIDEQMQAYEHERAYYLQQGNQAKAEEVQQRMARAALDISVGLERLDAMTARYAANPQDKDALVYLGHVAVAKGEFAKAIEYFKRGVELFADDDRMWEKLGVVYATSLDFDRAIHAFNQALKLKQEPKHFLNLGNAFIQRNETDAAVKILAMGLKFFPTFSDLSVLLAEAYHTRGEADAAEAVCRAGLAHDPMATDLIKTLIYANRLPLQDPLVAHAEALVASKETPYINKMSLCFVLGYYFQQHKLYDKAFGYFEQGNALRQSTFTYDPTLFDTMFKENKQYYASCHTPDFAQADPVEGFTPIFIVGMPRSGTSLLEQVLSSVDGVFGAGELPFIHKLCMQELPKFFPVSYPYLLSSFDEKGTEFANKIAQHYVTEVRKRAGNAPVVIDKMPQNFLFLGMIRRLFPNAKILHAMRSPMDNCLSIYSYSFEGRHDYAYSLENIGHYYQHYRDLMDFWKSLYPDWIMDVHYEDLVGDFEVQSRRILDFCGLPWNDKVLSFHEVKRDVRTASAGQVNQPLYKTSVEKWRIYEKQLQPLALALGKYGPQHD